MEDLTTTETSWFLTLTYDQIHIPVTSDYVPTLQRQRFQNWINATKRRTGPFQHYAVGEYGDDTMRPHYHMAIFPTQRSQIDDIADQWTYGNISCYPLIPQRARYLARYTAKKLTKADDSRLASCQEPEFRKSSTRPPLGLALARKIAAQYKKGIGKEIVRERGDIERTIRIAQKVYPIAPFLLDKIREELGIPTRHLDRQDHPGYNEWHALQEATWEPEIARFEETQYAEKEAINKTRRQAI